MDPGLVPGNQDPIRELNFLNFIVILLNQNKPNFMNTVNKYGLKLDNFELYVLNNISAYELENIQGILNLESKNQFTYFIRNPEKAKDLNLIKKVSKITDTPAMDLIQEYRLGYESLTAKDLNELESWDQINFTTIDKIITHK